MTRKEEIQSLRKLGLTYNQISDKTGYAKSMIAYYLNPTTKKKVIERTTKIRNGEIIEKINKYNIPTFLVSKISNYKVRQGKRNKPFNENLFTINEFYEKFGRYTNCYLTGKKIDLFEKWSYEFDHIIPLSKGGKSSLENLGITIPEANYAKGALSVEELYNLCKKIIKFHKKKLKDKSFKTP